MSAPDLDLLLESSAAIFRLPIEPSWRDAVRMNLKVVLEHAAKVEVFPLPDSAEPAPLFDAFEGMEGTGQC